MCDSKKEKKQTNSLEQCNQAVKPMFYAMEQKHFIIDIASKNCSTTPFLVILFDGKAAYKIHEINLKT